MSSSLESPSGFRDEVWRQQIASAERKVPRFLFRWWYDGSCSHKDHHQILNDPAGITPLAFAVGKKSVNDSFFDIPQEEIADTALKHLTGAHEMHSIFSSWSHSLPLILVWAKAWEAYEGSHLSILDTTKLSPSRNNVVVHADALRDVLKDLVPSRWIPNEHEFLAYGIIEGEAHQAVSWSKLKERGVAAFSDRTGIANVERQFAYAGNPPSGWETRIKTARNIGSLFRGDFELGVITHLMSIFDVDVREHANTVQSLADMVVPRAWLNETQDIDHRGLGEAVNAIRLMKKLARAKHGGGDDIELSEVARESEEDIAEQREGAISAMSRSKDVPGEVVSAYRELMGSNRASGSTTGQENQEESTEETAAAADADADGCCSSCDIA